MRGKRFQQTLRDKVVVITGASSGVGKATALELAHHGAVLFLAARRKDLLEELAEQCVHAGGKATAVQADVTGAQALRHLAAAASQYNGRIDVWFNNAGVLAAGQFDVTPVEVHEQVIRTNLLGYLYGAHAVLPYFRKQRHGLLINNISVGGWFPAPYGVAYSASKFGLRGFSQSLRAELTKWPHIHVCDLYPGFLDTPGVHHAANYTEHALRPSPPVYDPQRVARAVRKLIAHPKKQRAIGAAAVLLRAADALMPSITRSVALWAVEAYLKQAAPAPLTSGNLFVPMESGTAVYGGWQMRPSVKRMVNAACWLAGMAMAFFVVQKKVRTVSYR